MLMLCILPFLSLFLFVWLCSSFEIDLALALAGLEVSHYYSLQKNYNNLVTLACGKGPWSLSICFCYCGTSYEIGHLKVQKMACLLQKKS